MTSDTPQRQRYPRGQGERLREELVEATIELLAETDDPADVSVRAVARRVGVSPTAVYRHFEDREDLLRAAIEACFNEFELALDEAAAAATDAFDALWRRGRAYLEYAMAGHGHYRVLFSNPAPLDDKGVLVGYSSFEKLVEAVQACLDAGAPAEDDAFRLAVELWTWIHGIVDLRITHPLLPWPPAEELFDTVTRKLSLAAPDA
ncbi:MAG: hypothetical protein JJLCMIEE_03655 [Acidimicrobiales bacterium]|nr:MAG: TetR/AcrR family transcriptional regulator [Actinomycetota bacterium]MBV6510499.1 hypothetical protein [Acidimicrobiales bacterium]RIK07149.1 MAG: TetR/AcrR family transcriptional regulator [Acidobacteriota bacterium]